MFALKRSSTTPGWVGCAPQGARSVMALVESTGQAPPIVRWTEVENWRHPGRALSRLRRSRQIGRHRRVVLLQRHQYQCLTMDAPTDVPRQDWAQALRWQLAEAVDFPMDSAALDVLAVPDDTSYRGTPQVIAVASPESAMRPLVTVAAQARLPWHAVDVAETALRNLSLLASPEDAQALLHCEPRHATLVVTCRGELLSSRQIDLSLLDIERQTTAVRQQLFDQAGLELQRTLDGIERAYGQVTLKRLLVTPMPGQDLIFSHLRPLLYVPVEPLALEGLLDWSAVPELLADSARLNQCLLAIGAALRSD